MEFISKRCYLLAIFLDVFFNISICAQTQPVMKSMHITIPLSDKWSYLFKKVDIFQTESYHYIHKKHEKLLPKLTKALQLAIEKYGPLVKPEYDLNKLSSFFFSLKE